MTSIYVESSALLRVVLEGDVRLGREIETFERLVTCALTPVEALRALARAARGRRVAPKAFRLCEERLRQFEASAASMVLDGAVLDRARRPFAAPVRTLDAIHLASIEIWRTEIGCADVASTDDRVREGAAALGCRLWPRINRGL